MGPHVRPIALEANGPSSDARLLFLRTAPTEQLDDDVAVGDSDSDRQKLLRRLCGGMAGPAAVAASPVAWPAASAAA